MIRKLNLSVKPFSINGMYYSQKAVKTQAAREWTYDVFSELSSEKNRRAMEELGEAFDPGSQYFRIKLIAFYPKKYLLTKANAISAKSIDITNWEKPLVDLIFLPKHQQKEEPFGCQNIGYDDRYICEMSSCKMPWEHSDHGIIVEIEIKNNQDLYRNLGPDLGI